MTGATASAERALIDAVEKTALKRGGIMQPETISGSMKVTEDRQSIVKEFEWAITELQSVVEELHQRLVPVTRNEPMEMRVDDPLLASSEARSRLQDLQATTASLRGLLHRLEV